MGRTSRGGRAPAVALGVVACLLATFAGAGAEPGVDALRTLVTTRHADIAGYLPARHAGRVRVLEQGITSLRADLGTASFAQRVRALYRVDGLSLPEVSLPAPSARDLRAVRSLPRGLRRPVAGLLAATGRARREIGDISPSRLARDTTVIGRYLGSFPKRARHAQVLERSLPPGGTGKPSVVRQWPGLLPPNRSLSARTREAMRHDPVASLLVAEALDRYLPVIERFRSARSSAAPEGTSADATGCDMLDQTPFLCVGSSSATTFTADAVLLIDLGGNDSYTNTAGGAPFLSPAVPNYLPLSVNVDLGGDDTYRTQTTLSMPGVNTVSAVVGEGAAYLGAVGFLVDAAGNDTYTATAPDPVHVENPPPLPTPVAAVQGTGMFASGVLFDAAGDDHYTGLDRGHDVTASSNVFAQGMGAAGNAGGCTIYAPTAPPYLGMRTSCSLGALVDAGGGDDTYLIDTTQAGDEGEFFRSAIGQGMGEDVAGVLADDGGTDSFTITDRSGKPGAISFGIFPMTTIIPIGQGWSAAGAGLLLEGDGDTTYTIDAVAEDLAWNYEVGGQGLGLAEGEGALDDLGGDDTYSVHSHLPERVAPSKDDATCHGPDDTVCPQARQLWIGNIGGPMTEVHAQGEGEGIGSTGLLHDHAGDDSYTARAEAHLDVTLHDHLSNPHGPATLEVVSFSAPLLWAQGHTSGDSAGVLADGGGTDSYVAEELNDAQAAAHSDHASTDLTLLMQYQTFLGAQGSGNGGPGALLDLGGAGDTFVSRAMNPASAPGGRVYRWGNYWMPAQGMGTGGELVALGSGPTFVTQPGNGVGMDSPDPHGGATWLSDTSATFGGSPPGADADHQIVDNAGSYAAGFAPNATGTQPVVTFLPETSSGGGLSDTADVAARVTSAAGAPMSGVPVRFGLQYSGIQTLPGLEDHESYLNSLEVEAVTGVDGIARAKLPLNVSFQLEMLPDFTFYFVNADGYRWRLAATVDGAAGRYPAHVVRPFSLNT